MKHSFLLRSVLVIFFGLTMSVARAQYVAIPDSNFGSWLHRYVDSNCITGNGTIGWQMDTSCASVVNTTLLNVGSTQVRDLTCIQYFKNLRHLAITWIPFSSGTDDSLSYIPSLPATLTYLYCSYNKLRSLPSLPAGLDTLICSHSLINSLPSLPSSLMYLDCSFDSLHSLPLLPSSLKYLEYSNQRMHGARFVSPASLPSSLTYLDGSNNYPSTNLPSLPSTLTYLGCAGDSMTVLPSLPAGLVSLYCDFNSIRVIPALPSTLTTLSCSSDSITILPSLPSGLQSLSCDNDLLTSNPTLPSSLLYLSYSYVPQSVLPSLPAGLKQLSCSGGYLTVLPDLPDSLTFLSCTYSHISSIPSLPATISSLYLNNDTNLYCLPAIKGKVGYLYISGTHISCLPNRISPPVFSSTLSDVGLNSMPLCTPASGCPFYYNISGNVHFDSTATCALDSIHPAAVIPGMKVKLIQSGQTIQQMYTSGVGEYAFKTDTFGGYTVAFDTTGYPFSYVCPTAGERSVSVTAADSLLLSQNFGVECTHIDSFYTDYGVHDMYNHFMPFRPGRNTWVEIGAGDLARWDHSGYCQYEYPTGDTSGVITTTFSGPVHYVGPAPWSLTPSSVSGNTLTYNISNLQRLFGSFPYYTFYGIDIILATDSGAALGAQVCVTTTVTSSTPDANPADDSLTHCFTVVNSWDPNHKTVVPADTFRSGDWLTYTVQFQNKGTAPALTVMVRDTLSQYVDANSFQLIASSHRVVTQVAGNAVTFTFADINLPDSAANAMLSQGWVEYKVKAKPNLPLTTQVKNTAYIYFDINAAVVTNTTVNTVDTSATPLAIRTVTSNNSIALYPNPNKGAFTLQTVNGQQSTNSFTITDMLGNVVMTHPINADRQAVMMPADAAGVYTLVVKGAQPIRFVVVR